MSEVAIVGVLTVLGSLVVALLGTNWLNRRNISRLTAAQAGSAEATTLEISDRIARGWIKDLESKIGNLTLRVDEEVRIRRGAIGYIERLLEWIKDNNPNAVDVPSLPETLKAYVSEPH